jgi:hypothetical protein
MSTHPDEYTHVHHTSMSTSERLSQLDLEIYKVDHQEQRRYLYTSTHTYEYTQVHPISISISKRLSRLNLKIHEVDH